MVQLKFSDCQTEDVKICELLSINCRDRLAYRSL